MQSRQAVARLRSPSAPCQIALPRGRKQKPPRLRQALALAAPAEMLQARCTCGHLLSHDLRHCGRYGQTERPRSGIDLRSQTSKVLLGHLSLHDAVENAFGSNDKIKKIYDIASRALNTSDFVRPAGPGISVDWKNFAQNTAIALLLAFRGSASSQELFSPMLIDLVRLSIR